LEIDKDVAFVGFIPVLHAKLNLEISEYNLSTPGDMRIAIHNVQHLLLKFLTLKLKKQTPQRNSLQHWLLSLPSRRQIPD
jgi:hypothetical protein